jgi:HSP20 family protein
MPRPGPWRRELTHPIHVLQTELNRLFDEYWHPGRVEAAGPAPMDLEAASWSPAVDVVESPDGFVVSAELPGVDPSTIDLSVTGNVLTLRGVKPFEGTESPGTGPLRERKFGPFHRQVTLPGEVNYDAAQAEARQGVLIIRIPKQEASKPRTIRVQTA